MGSVTLTGYQLANKSAAGQELHSRALVYFGPGFVHRQSMREHLAWIPLKDQIYLCRSVRNETPQPFSAVTLLIQAIWETEPDQARKLLRERILTTLPNLTPMDQGFVRVAAKRIHFGINRAEFGHAHIQDLTQTAMSLIKPIEPFIALGTTLDPIQALNAIRAYQSSLRAGTLSNLARYRQDRAVAAILLSKEGQVLEATANTNARNRTLHAEVRAIQSHWSRRKAPIPPGATLIVSLQCCRMCAGLIVNSSEDASRLKVIYDEPDPGPMARNTELQRLKIETQASID